MKRLVPVMAALIIALSGAAARADFAAGAKAYDGGDYATAFSEWIGLARADDATAQVAIAGMFRFGEGRRVDLVEAARWYRRAADLGEPIAQLNLGEMYLLGIGVPRDAVRAHLWLSLATRQGRAWARDKRDALARSMSRDQLDRADKLLHDRGAR
jgi:hypothetical protein